MTEYLHPLMTIIGKLTGAGLVAAALVAYAMLAPDAIISAKSKLFALIAAGCIVVGMICYSTGISNENSFWQAKWDAEQKAAIARGADAHTRAGDDVDRGVPDGRDSDN